MDNYFSILFSNSFETYKYKFNTPIIAEGLYKKNINIDNLLTKKINHFFSNKNNFKKLINKNILDLNMLINLFKKDFNKLEKKKIILTISFTLNFLYVLKKNKIKKIILPKYSYLYINFVHFISKKRIKKYSDDNNNESIYKIKKYLNNIFYKFKIVFPSNYIYNYVNIDGNFSPFKVFDKKTYSEYRKLICLILKKVKKTKKLMINSIGKIDCIKNIKINNVELEDIQKIEKIFIDKKNLNNLKLIEFIRNIHIYLKEKNINVNNNGVVMNFNNLSIGTLVLKGYSYRNYFYLKNVNFIYNFVIDNNLYLHKKNNVVFKIKCNFFVLNITNKSGRGIKIIIEINNFIYTKEQKKIFLKFVNDIMLKKYIEPVKKEKLIISCLFNINIPKYKDKIFNKIKKYIKTKINKNLKKENIKIIIDKMNDLYRCNIINKKIEKKTNYKLEEI